MSLKIKSENSLKPFQNLVKFLSLLAVLLGLMYFDEFFFFDVWYYLSTSKLGLYISEFVFRDKTKFGWQMLCSESWASFEFENMVAWHSVMCMNLVFIFQKCLISRKDAKKLLLLLTKTYKGISVRATTAPHTYQVPEYIWIF